MNIRTMILLSDGGTFCEPRLFSQVYANKYPPHKYVTHVVDAPYQYTRYARELVLNPFRTAVSFWGQLGTNYLEFECLVPKTGLEF